MQISRDRQRYHYILLLTVLIVLLILTSLLSTLLLASAEGENSPWEGYRVYAFALHEAEERLSAEAMEEIEALFSSYGYTELIHRYNERLRFFSYEGEKSAGLDELSTRYEYDDPLYDPYMRGIERYFEGELAGKPAELVYVSRKRGGGEESSGLLSTVDVSRAALDLHRLHGELDELDRDFALTGYETDLTRYLFIFEIILALVLLFPVGRKRRLLYAAGVIPVLSTSFDSSFPAFSAALLLIIAWALLVNTGKEALQEYVDLNTVESRRRLRYAALRYGAILTLSLGIALFSGEGGGALMVLGQFGRILAQLSVGGVYLSLRLLKRRRYAHVPFYPRTIRAGYKLPSAPLNAVCLGFLLASALPPLLFYGTLSFGGTLRIPAPQGEVEGGFTWERIGRLADTKDNKVSKDSNEVTALGQADGGGPLETPLPDLSDYLSHRAYQQSYFYGGTYEFPRRNGSIRIDNYRREGTNVKREESVVKMFTEPWYKDIIGEAYTHGVTRLLLSQKGPSRVRMEQLRVLQIRKQTLWGHTGIYLVVSLVLFISKRRKQTYEPLSKENTAMRKGRKVA